MIFRRALLAMLLLSLWVIAASAGIAYHGLGTGSGVVSGTSITLSSGGNITVGQGSTLVVFIEYDPTIEVLSGVSWNNQQLVYRSVNAPSVGELGMLSCYTLSNAIAGTAPIIADASLAAPVSQWLATFVEVTGASVASFDKIGEGSGTGTAPVSGTTGTRSQNNEMVLGCIAWATGAISGTWNATQNLAPGQSSAGATCSMEDAFLVVSNATPAKAAYKTLCTNTGWGAVVISIKEDGLVGSVAEPVRLRPIGGGSRSRVRRR